MDRGSALYRQYLAGDEEGMYGLIREYRDGLAMFLMGFVHDASAAEQLAEDTFVRLAVKKPHDSGNGSFKTWLYTIGRNIALDHLRKTRRERTVPLEAAALSVEERSLEDAYIRDERRRAVRRAMERLSEDHRQILFLVYFEELSLKDAAKVMRRSAHAAEALAMRARQALKKELEREGIDHEDL